ncbi:MFS transporter, partial [Mycobacterium sp.]|uniref:MFS transporter n=1 Tax=Mycobacterium sp. TaxID=1785 RepID=UPI002D8E81F8|nr:MFS transporter [Mycobacterium sp.]
MSETRSGSRTWLTRNVRVLSAVSFLQDAASELLYPLLPIYLTAVLGAPASVVGAVEGAAEGAASLTKLAAGPLGDRFSRRPLIATGYGMAALGKVFVAAATVWPGVLAGRVVDRLGKGIRGAPRDALLVADIDDTARGRVFGFHRAMDTLGAVVGPLLGLAGYELLDHQIAPLLWVAVVPAVLSVALVFLVREQRRVLPRVERKAIFAKVGELPRRYWRVTAVLVAFGVVNFPDALLLLRLNEIGFSVVEVILAYVTYNAVYAVSSYPAGLLADRIPRPAVFGIGLVFFAIGYGGLGLTTDAATAWVLIGAYGLFAGCTDGVGKAWISSLVGGDVQGSAQGVFQGLSGFAVLAAGLWA